MDKRDAGLEHLCKLYLNLNDEDREKIIRLGEGLLNSQKIIDMEKVVLSKENQTGVEHKIV